MTWILLAPPAWLAVAVAAGLLVGRVVRNAEGADR